MSITDNKITRWNNPIVNEADRPQRSASDMKAIFDSNSNQLRTALNNLIDHLAASGAEDIGAEIEDMEGQTVEELLAELKGLVDAIYNIIDTSADGQLFLANDGTYRLPSVGAAANGVKEGGTAGSIYTKNSNKMYDGKWATLEELGILDKETYDTDRDGVVNEADNARQLGGKDASQYQSAVKSVVGTLALTNWEGTQAPYMQTIQVTGLQANDVIFAGGAETYNKSGIECIAQAAGTLTFSCQKVPSANVPVNIVIIRR